MKKAITILAVLIVLVGAVFATSEQHDIKVKADVAAVEPAIQLRIQAYNSELDDYKTNTTPNAYDGTKSYAAQAEGQAIDVNFNLNENGSVVAYAYLANYAKTNKVYTLAFSGGDFAAKKNKGNYTHSPTSITTAVMEGQAAVTRESDGAALYEVALVSGNQSNRNITVTFHGKTVVEKDVPLAKATYAYTGDDDIDPTTPQNPWYYADITLTVSTT